MSPRTRRPSHPRRSPKGRVHPDDVLRRLARVGVGPIGPVVRGGYRRRRDPLDIVLLIAAGVLAVITIVVLAPSVAADRHAISVSGLVDGMFINSPTLAKTTAEIHIRPASQSAQARVTVNGQRVPVVVQGDRILWRPASLPEGNHLLQVQSGARFLWRGPARASVHFTVDDAAPALTVARVVEPVAVDRAVSVTGTVEPGAEVVVAGRQATVTGERFSIRFPSPPVGTFAVVARDAAGNEVRRESRVPVTLPMVRAVHISARGWVTASLREPVLTLADQGLINAVQLDVKEETGRIGHRSSVPLASVLGAAEDRFELRDAVDKLHARGLRVIGRIVVYRDPVLAKWAVENGRPELLVLNGKGKPYQGSYGLAFTNPASEFVRAYNLAVAREAAEMGVDEILFDYIRRPEGELTKMVFPGLKGSVEDEIVGFLHDAARTLDGTDTRLGVSVFGIAARNPSEIGQNVPRIATAVDYVAPMVYPSHWLPNFYNVADPVSEPYRIVHESLKDFQLKLAGTGVAVVPWLQDFSLGRRYGAVEVRAQIDAAHALGIQSFMLWDPKVTYTEGGLRPITAAAAVAPQSAGTPEKPEPAP